MKAFVGRPLVGAAFVVFFILLLFYPQTTNKELVTQRQVINKASLVRLTIPVINVNANIQEVGVTQTGEMDVPSNVGDVAWFKLGSFPGEKGSAVISGHLNGVNGEKGVFIDLHKLKKGDRLYIEDDKGKTISFIVRKTRIYDSGYAEEIFGLNDGAHLNLITCDGVWDEIKKNYNKRLVIFSDILD